jgi:hypothetical protein
MMLLWTLIAAIHAVILAAWIHHAWKRHHPDHISASEWLERFRAIDAEMPLRGPRFLSRYVSKGAEGISSPERKQKPGKLAVVKKRNGTR